jgi:ketosteroid isomerase-like protein
MKYLTADEAGQFSKQWLPAWSGNNPELLASFYSEDAVYLDPGIPGGVKGKSQFPAQFPVINEPGGSSDGYAPFVCAAVLFFSCIR